MDKLRLRYEQTGSAAWCSHLDMMRTLQRALLRAKAPLRYSEGFNPHALLSILMPLPVGTESLCQLADIRLREDTDLETLPERLSAVMPQGVRVTAAYEEGEKPALLKWLRAEGRLLYPEGDAAEMASACAAFFHEGPVTVLRRTKRGEGTLILTEHVRKLSFQPAEGAVVVSALCSAAEPVVNPELIAAALAQNRPALAPAAARLCRMELYKENDAVFR